MRGCRAVLHVVLHILLLVTLTVTPLSVGAQETVVDAVAQLLSEMSPEARVGQLVLVSFPGTDVTASSEIASLVREYRIGGVILRPENGNFGAPRISASDLLSLTNQLQQATWSVSGSAPSIGGLIDPDAVASTPYVPLLVAVGGTSGGLPITAYVTGTSSLPSPMAIGATWNRDYAQQVGALLGEELAALGVNLFLGPSLDVLYTPRPGDPSDLGTRVFGGDPFWVGELGQAFVAGLHEGGEGHLLVAPRHFPGLGSADRALEDEVPTVPKTLEQLRQVELPPFLAVAGGAPGQAETADAFLVTHIRYRGFQGNNIRRTTRPISLDANALLAVLGLPGFSDWRQAGGVLISDNLGMLSVHRSYDPRGMTFNARRVALDALRAGNDLLILDRFAPVDDWDAHFSNVRDTLGFLAAQYREDPSVQALVDSAVYRILGAKLRINPDRTLQLRALSSDGFVETVSKAQPLSAQIASRALTLVSPLTDDLLPAPPRAGDLIVIFSQSRVLFMLPDGGGNSAGSAKDPAVATLLKLYGPDATGVVRPDLVRSFTFAELSAALAVGSGVGTVPQAEGESLTSASGDSDRANDVLQALRDARWIIFLTARLDPQDAESGALKVFLAQQANLVEARIAVLSFGPPYELDSTEISKIDVFYALYSFGSAFMETGIRAVFRDLPALGSSPVDIPALNYNLAHQLMPAPQQVLSLAIVDAAGTELTPTALSDIQVGDLIHLRTNLIVDRNNNPVPDGTPVSFVLRYPLEGIERALIAETIDGVAGVSVALDRVGQLDITALSEPALSSVRLELNIRDDGLTVTEIEPTPTATPSPTSTPTPEPLPTTTPAAALAKLEQLPDPITLPRLKGRALLIWGGFGAAVASTGGYLLSRWRRLTVSKSVRIALMGFIAGWSCYVLVLLLGRLQSPIWLYSAVGREALAAAFTLIPGSIAVALATSMYKGRDYRNPASRRAGDDGLTD